MPSTTRVTKGGKTGPAIYSLNDSSGRCALAVDGLVRYCGPIEECQRRLALITRPDAGRDRQDKMLPRACS